MKKLILTALTLISGAVLTHAQGGQVSWTDATAKVTTNSTLYATGYPSTIGGFSGLTLGGVGSYYYVLLTATSTTPVDSGNPFGPDWNVMSYASGGIAYGTNSLFAGGVTGPGGGGGFASSLTAGLTYDDMVVGWSASVGTSWAQILSYGPGIANFAPGGYFGYSNVGTIIPTTTPNPPGSIIGGTSAQPGQIELYLIEPEPATLSLFCLGGLSVLFLRRRNTRV